MIIRWLEVIYHGFDLKQPQNLKLSSWWAQEISDLTCKKLVSSLWIGIMKINSTGCGIHNQSAKFLHAACFLIAFCNQNSHVGHISTLFNDIKPKVFLSNLNLALSEVINPSKSEIHWAHPSVNIEFLMSFQPFSI